MPDRWTCALAVLAASLAAWPAAGGTVRGRVRRFSHPRRGQAGGRSGVRPRSMSPLTRRWLVAAAAGSTATVVLGGTWGPLLGVAVTVAVERVLRRGTDRRTEDDEKLVTALPLACDLLAVCLETGIPPGSAVAAVAEASPPPLGAELSRVARLYRLGAEPARAWAGAPVPLEGLARVFVRAGGSGSSVVPALRALSSDIRGTSRARTDAAVRRAGVWVLAPLGACFLPAFLCLGVVPLVLGIAHDVFG